MLTDFPNSTVLPIFLSPLSHHEQIISIAKSHSLREDNKKKKLVFPLFLSPYVSLTYKYCTLCKDSSKDDWATKSYRTRPTPSRSAASPSASSSDTITWWSIKTDKIYIFLPAGQKYRQNENNLTSEVGTAIDTCTAAINASRHFHYATSQCDIACSALKSSKCMLINIVIITRKPLVLRAFLR